MTGPDRVIRAGLVVSLGVVTVIAVAVSYGHLWDLAKDNGETGVPAAVLPVTVDGLILATSLVIVNAARNRSRPPVLAWLLLLAGIGATLAGNIAHGIEHGWPGSLVAGWPAVVAGGCFHLVIGEIRRGREAVTSDDAPSTMSADLHSQDPEWADDRPVGMELWATVATTPEPVATTGREAVPALEPAPLWETPGDTRPDVEPGPDATTDPDLAPVVATARDRFAEVIAAGDLPSLRAIRREINVGYPRAVQVRDALTNT